jgi:hypothetical protein
MWGKISDWESLTVVMSSRRSLAGPASGEASAAWFPSSSAPRQPESREPMTIRPRMLTPYLPSRR